MSSLLQFDGEIDKHKGVRLECYLVKHSSSLPLCHVPTELVDCHICGKQHPKLYGFWRKPCGTWGHWVLFRYLGHVHPPDLSIPIEVEKLPRGAVELPIEAWHKEAKHES